jgi:hypothetical protein
MRNPSGLATQLRKSTDHEAMSEKKPQQIAAVF